MPTDEDQVAPDQDDAAESEKDSENSNGHASSESPLYLSAQGDIAGRDKIGRDRVDGNKFEIQTLSHADIQIISLDRTIRDILTELRFENKERHRPPPLPADATLQEQVEHWFKNDLESRPEKLFVVTLSMFSGLRFAEFMDVYQIVLTEFSPPTSEAEVEADPVAVMEDLFTSDEELIEKCRVRIERDKKGLEEFVNFKDPQYEDAILKLLRRYHRPLLLKLLPALKRIGELRDREVRSRAAEAVAEIGKLGLRTIREVVLDKWAYDGRGHVRASVGYTLSRLYADKNSQAVVRDLLEEWSEKRGGDDASHWRARWTVASSYKQIGFDHLDMACAGLKQVARYNDLRVADAVIHTFVVLSLQRDQLVPIVRVLGQWVEEGTGGKQVDQEREIICRVALLAFIVLSQIHIEIVEEEIEGDAEQFTACAGNLLALISTNRSENNNLWQVVVSIGIRALENDLKDAFFELIRRWVNQAQGNDVLVQIMADVYGQSRSHYRTTIFNRLGHWGKRRSAQDQRLSQFAGLAKAEIKKRYG